MYNGAQCGAASDYEMACYYPLNGYRSIKTGGLTFRPEEHAGTKMTVACGACIGCRIDRSQLWAIRITHEAHEHEDNCFITLTYNEENLPRDGSLNVKDFQKFMKRLRKKFPGRRIKYYHCGEYGEDYTRPHYHACIFGLDFEDKELISQKRGNKLYASPMLANTWGMGFVTIGALTFESAAYCARYITKKITGKKADDHYLRCDENGVAFWLTPEYSTMSKGIGAKWYEKYKTDLWPSDEVPVPDRGIYKKVPRYYETILQQEDPDTYDKIKQLRKQWHQAHKEEYTDERLEQKERVKLAQISTLTRGFEQ